MRSTLFAVACALVLVAPTPARAQTAAALGQPLPATDLDPGTVSVRVIAGSPANPVVGTDVTLVVNGTPRSARTDSAGRAFFKDLPAGATIKATVKDEDQKEIASSEFELPDTGVRLMLSTKPFEPGAGGAPFAGGMGGGMPEPRQLSGEPRGEQADQPGTLTARLTYDDFKDAPPPPTLVALVGYHADDSLDVHVARSDADGRAQFGGLDIKGETSYFAMAKLPRGAAVDRMISVPAVLDSRNGVRLVLSADKRASTAPPVDDITRLEKQDHAPAAGKVRVALEGVPDNGAKVHLIALSAPSFRRTIAEVAPVRADADPSDVQARAQFKPQADVAAHVLHVQVHGGAGVDEPIAGALVKIYPAKAKPGSPAVDGAAAVATPDGGELELNSPANEPVIAELSINGKVLRSQPLDLTRAGGILDVDAQWESVGKLVAEADLSSVRADEVVIAETTMRGVVYRSIPFQPVPDRGTAISLYIFPRVMFSFSLTSHIDDEFLAVQGRFEITNNAWAPYVGGNDGLVIPLPAHFRGAIVAEQDQGDVAVAQGQGFRIGRPIPPGGKQFHAGFSLPVEGGHVDWQMDLPLGTFQSGMEILKTPGMTVDTPPKVQAREETDPRGTFAVVAPISILPKQSMRMAIDHLPQPPAWRVWAPRLAAVAAIATMLAGLALALVRTRRLTTSDRAARRSQLFDELVELERSGEQHAARRAQITEELESLWDD